MCIITRHDVRIHTVAPPLAYHCHLYISLQLQVLVITEIIFFLSQHATQMSRAKLSRLRLSTKSYDAVK